MVEDIRKLYPIQDDLNYSVLSIFFICMASQIIYESSLSSLFQNNICVICLSLYTAQIESVLLTIHTLIYVFPTQDPIHTTVIGVVE